MIDIRGRETDESPGGVIDIEPYVALLQSADLGGCELLSNVPPAAVYRSNRGDFDHVLYPLNRSSRYVVVVVDVSRDQVHGHHVLDLHKEYGLDAAV